MSTRVNRTEAIKHFLTINTRPDLASLYNHDMEVQVNVLEAGGERIDGEYKGRRWVGYTDGVTQWKPYRIPRNANTKPEYDDQVQTWDLSKYAEGIGMTGWDWKNKRSLWVAFDFDAITGHSEKHQKKLTEDELRSVRETISTIDWATIRTSTSGSGLHIYVFFNPPIETNTHTEHAALGRSVLGLMSALTGVEFSTKVDACGQNMWIWHRKMIGTNGLTLVKQGIPLNKVPPNWRDHLNVLTNKRRRVLPDFIVRESDEERERIFDELSGQRSNVPLDAEHKRLIEYLNSEENKFYFAWDSDNRMITTHTKALKIAHEKLGLVGIYRTISEGTDYEQNCFMFPTRKGGWVVRRFTFGVAEAPTWDVDRSGWTRCYYNTMPDLKTAASAFGGLENAHGAYVFRTPKDASDAVKAIGGTIDIPAAVGGRQVTLKENDSGKLVVSLEKLGSDVSGSLPPGTMDKWIDSKKSWTQVLPVKAGKMVETEVGNFDDVVRHIVDGEHVDAGWVLNANGIWISEPLTHVRSFLSTFGLNPKETTDVVGGAIGRCWYLVNRPFQPEYPGNRQWNRNAVQLKFPPSPYSDQLYYPTWTKMLDHLGAMLTPNITKNKWCRDNGIKTGGDYLKCWVASAIQSPEEQLPYLFFWSKEQKTGKTTFHESLDLLLTKGVVRADQALSPDSKHNAELEDGVFCVIEEQDLGGKAGKAIYNRIKDLVTSKTILIHPKYMTPYKAVNTTHWIHCANDPDAVPIYEGDTRIISINVQHLPQESLIPKHELEHILTKEAPDFLSAILHLEIPEHRDRFKLPVIETQDKEDTAHANMNPLERFIMECTFYAPQETMLFSEFHAAFKKYLGDDSSNYWNANRVGRDMDRVRFPRGKLPGDSQTYVANISFTEPTEEILKRQPLKSSPDRVLGVHV
jgi:hypothetical protein